MSYLLIEKQYQRAISILKKNKDKLIQLAEILVEKEVIFEGDLRKIFGARPFAKEEPAETEEVIEDSKPKNSAKKSAENSVENKVETTVEKPESKDSEIAEESSK